MNLRFWKPKKPDWDPRTPGYAETVMASTLRLARSARCTTCPDLEQCHGIPSRGCKRVLGEWPHA